MQIFYNIIEKWNMAEKIIVPDKIANKISKSNKSGEKTIWVTDESKSLINKVLEEYSVFWTPNKVQQEIIKKMNEAWRQKLIDIGLKYHENTIEMKIEWEKVVFPKEQPFQDIVQPEKWDDYWQASMDAIKKLPWRKPIEETLFNKISKIFKWKAELLWLNNDNDYWLATESKSLPNNAWYGGFKDGNMTSYIKSSSSIYTICIHG
jgi:hypothetical protein